MAYLTPQTNKITTKITPNSHFGNASRHKQNYQPAAAPKHRAPNWHSYCLSLTIIATHGIQSLAMTMNINLTPQLEDLVRQKVASGRYNSASEVVREALRLLEEQDRLRAAKLETLRRDIREGLDSGPPVPWDVAVVKREGRKRLAARQTSHARQK